MNTIFDDIDDMNSDDYLLNTITMSGIRENQPRKWQERMWQVFEEKLIPLAIEKPDIPAIDVIILWKCWQYKDNWLLDLSRVFFGDNADLFQIYLDDDNHSTAKRILIEENEPTNEEMDELLSMLLDYVHNSVDAPQLNALKIKSYVEISNGRSTRNEPTKEREMINNHLDVMHNKIVPAISTPELKALWQQAKNADDVERMAYLFFLNKYICKYAKGAVKEAYNWSDMLQILQNPLPTTADDILHNLQLLRKIASSMGLDIAPYTIGDVLGVFKEYTKLKQLIVENEIS